MRSRSSDQITLLTQPPQRDGKRYRIGRATQRRDLVLPALPGHELGTDGLEPLRMCHAKPFRITAELQRRCASIEVSVPPTAAIIRSELTSPLCLPPIPV
jgi:hypothetical protein